MTKLRGCLIIKTRGSFPNDDAALKLLYLAIKNAGMRRRRGRSNGRTQWGNLPSSSARPFRDRRDDHIAVGFVLARSMENLSNQTSA
jgi:hypothetical protein